MADNTTLNPGSGGDVLATDDIGGGVKIQRVKIESGADGSLDAYQLTPTCVAHTSGTSIAAGCKALLLIASSDFAGTVLANFPMPAGSSLNIPVPAGKTLGAVAYTRTAGTLYSIELR